jgi:hypothetical protein
VDPLEVFERIVGVVRPTDPGDPAAVEAQKRAARNQSVLDAVLENAQRTRARLGTSARVQPAGSAEHRENRAIGRRR